MVEGESLEERFRKPEENLDKIPKQESLAERLYRMLHWGEQKKLPLTPVYFHATIYGTLGEAYGCSKQQVITAFEDFKSRNDDINIIKIPTPEQIAKTNKISIHLVRPICDNYLIEMDLEDGVIFNVHPNAFGLVQHFLKNYSSCDNTYGELYALDSGVQHFYLVPEIVVEKMKAYDWNRHSKTVEGYMKGYMADLFGAVLESDHIDPSILKRFDPRQNGGFNLKHNAEGQITGNHISKVGEVSEKWLFPPNC